MNKKRSFTDDQFLRAIKNSQSWSETAWRLNKVYAGRSVQRFKELAKKLMADISHFKGMRWNFNGSSLKEILLELLLKKEIKVRSNNLKKKLIKANILKNKCSECGIDPIWIGKPLTLILDHKDGDRCNNEVNNLRILCPNCHSQTPTFCIGISPGGGRVDASVLDADGGNPREGANPSSGTKNEKVCPICKATFVGKTRKYCSQKCSHFGQRKVRRPTRKNLEDEMLKSTSFLALGRRYGVSDNAVRKWVVQYGLVIPRRVASSKEKVPVGQPSSQTRDIKAEMAFDGKWKFCPLCKEAVILCEKCGNTTCNGGGCDECEDDFQKWFKMSSEERAKFLEESDRKLGVAVLKRLDQEDKKAP